MSDRVAAVLIDPTTGLPYTAIPVNIGSTVNRTASGNITSTQDVALSTAACGSAAFQVSGTWTGTLVFEYTIDDLAWSALSVSPDGGGPAVSSTMANGNWTVQVESYSQVRVRGNTVGSGTAAVFLSASTATSVVTIASPLPAGDNTIGRVKVTDGTNVASVSAGGALSVDASATTALPLPTGAATAAAQATANTTLSSLDGKTPALVAGRVPVDGSGVTQPVSGTVTANAGTGTFAISASALPLPAGAATAAKQPALGTAGTPSADVISVQGVPGGIEQNTYVTNAFALDATLTGGAARTKITDGTNNAAVVNAAPSTEYGLVVRQVPASATAPQGVELSDGSAFYTAAKTGQLPSALVGGRLDVNIGAGTVTVTPSGTQNVTGTGSAGTAATGVVTIQGIAGAVAVKTDGSATTQPVSIAATVAVSAASLPLPTGAATATLQTTGNTSLATLATNSPALVSGRVPVDGSGVTQPVSNANLDVALSTLSLKNQFPTTLGITTKASSLSVALASDQVGTAGSASTTVLSVQGVASGTNLNVAQATASSLNAQVVGAAAAGAALTGNPVLVAGSDGTSVRTLALDTTGRPAGSSKTFITTNVTTQVIKSGNGVLRAIVVNPGVTSAFLLYDSSGAASGQFSGAATTSPAYLYVIQYGPNGVAFTNGLVITTSGGTPAQLLVIYD